MFNDIPESVHEMMTKLEANIAIDVKAMENNVVTLETALEQAKADLAKAKAVQAELVKHIEANFVNTGN